MRFYLTIPLLLTLVHTAWADTTNREIQFSPVPGIFVGGVGLKCEANPSNILEFLLLTKDRQRIGLAVFENDDVTYDFLAITKTTPRTYIAEQENTEVVLDRQSLKLTMEQDYKCVVMSISNLHNAAKDFLRTLLSENKI